MYTYQHRFELNDLAVAVHRVQSASNIGGVLTLAKSASETLYRCKGCEGSDWVANHPLMVGIVDKLSAMTGTQTLGQPTAMAAHKWCLDHLQYMEEQAKLDDDFEAATDAEVFSSIMSTDDMLPLHKEN